jgi:hypothetical protein
VIALLVFAALCQESGTAPRPADVQAALANGHVQVALAVDSAGFNRTWTVVLLLDTNNSYGFWPVPSVCAHSDTLPDWWIAMNQFKAYSGCPCPTWFACEVGQQTAPGMVWVTREFHAGTLSLDFDLNSCTLEWPEDGDPVRCSIPVAVGQNWWLQVDQMYGGGDPRDDYRRAAWRFSGVLTEGAPPIDTVAPMAITDLRAQP